MMVQYTLVRSRRKTLAIHITREAAVEVRAPLKMPEAYIEGFVKKKEKWIEEHIARRKQVNDEKEAFTVGYGDRVSICGGEYPIRGIDGGRAGFDGESVWIPANLTPDQIKYVVIQVYRTTARRLLRSKTGEYGALMEVKPAAVRITGAKTRWGSCSGKDNINFSWRLLMADMDVIDYVVVHELAHLKELNHSSRFWAVVEGIIPDYKARERKLKQLQERLQTQDWDE